MNKKVKPLLHKSKARAKAKAEADVPEEKKKSQPHTKKTES